MEAIERPQSVRRCWPLTAKNSPSPRNSPSSLWWKAGLAKKSGVELEDVARGGQAAHQQGLGVVPTEVADEWRIWPPLHPLQVQIVGAGGAEELDGLADEGVVVL